MMISPDAWLSLTTWVLIQPAGPFGVLANNRPLFTDDAPAEGRASTPEYEEGRNQGDKELLAGQDLFLACSCWSGAGPTVQEPGAFRNSDRLRLMVLVYYGM